MINDAHFYLAEIERQNIELPYKYIIIDEFQDIARQRFNLTKQLSEITKAKVVAVGDDWQSIFAFSGSEIGLFTRFLELMGGLYDIYKCGQCKDGYMIVKSKETEAFYGCTNFDVKTKQGCKNTRPIFSQKQRNN